MEGKLTIMWTQLWLTWFYEVLCQHFAHNMFISFHIEHIVWDWLSVPHIHHIPSIEIPVRSHIGYLSPFWGVIFRFSFLRNNQGWLKVTCPLIGDLKLGWRGCECGRRRIGRHFWRLFIYRVDTTGSLGFLGHFWSFVDLTMTLVLTTLWW